jgi:hypothetical protein
MWPGVPGRLYAPLFSAAPNLEPTNTDLIKKINDRCAAVAAFDGVAPGRTRRCQVTPPPARCDPQTPVGMG